MVFYGDLAVVFGFGSVVVEVGKEVELDKSE